MAENQKSSSIDEKWSGLVRMGGFACVAMLVFTFIQFVVFILWPPPDSVLDFFNLFQKNALLGLLSMDLIYIANNTVLILIYLALYAALKPVHASAALIALVLGLVGIAAYYSSNTAFEMLSLSRQYAAAVSEAQRTALLGAGQSMLAIYGGTAFDVYYVFNAATLLIFSVLILRSPWFTRTIAGMGLASGVLMIIPSTAGTIGLTLSLASLLPWIVFLILITPRLFRLSKKASLRET
jgi:hypothetical protein